jgi:hypothetical protein
MRTTKLLALTGALGMLVAPVATAAGHGRAVTVRGTESDPDGIRPDGVGCSVADSGCRLNFTGHVTFAGDMRGAAAYALHFEPIPAADGLHYTGSEHFSALSTPCGTGSVDVDLNGVYQMTTFDVATHTTTIVEHGTFRHASGGLSGMTGAFTVTINDHNDTTADGRWIGTLTCQR